jgi:hypothetical protein
MVVKPRVVCDCAIDDPAQEGDVGASEKGDVQVGQRARPSKARVDADAFAPRALASITHWNPTGWHSAKFNPSMTRPSEF